MKQLLCENDQSPWRQRNQKSTTTRLIERTPDPRWCLERVVAASSFSYTQERERERLSSIVSLVCWQGDLPIQSNKVKKNTNHTLWPRRRGSFVPRERVTTYSTRLVCFLLPLHRAFELAILQDCQCSSCCSLEEFTRESPSPPTVSNTLSVHPLLCG